MNICKVCDRGFEDKNRKGRTVCGGCRTKIRRYRTKVAAIAYKGGKCMYCGWVGNIAAFEFHHRDSVDKDFTIANVANKSWELIKKEIDKCDLLCSNCHRIEHSNNEGEKFLLAVKDYKGRILDISLFSSAVVASD